MFLLFNPNIITSTWEGTLRYILLYKSIWTDRAYCRRIKWSKRLLLSSHSCVQRMLVIDDVIPNKRPIWAQYISLTLKPPFFRLLRLVYELCPSSVGAGWLWQHRGGCEDRPFKLPEQKRLREYFSLCEIAGKALWFSVGLFQRASNKLRSFSTSRAALKDMWETLKGEWRRPVLGIRLWTDNDQVSLFIL